MAVRRCRKNAGGVLLSDLLEEGIDDLLLLFHELLALLEPVRLALDVNHATVVQDPVKNGGSDGDIGKDLIPLGEGLVGGKDGGGFLVASGNELKEEVGTLNVYGEIANFIN